MKQRKLGALGPTVGALGLGCMGMTGRYGPADETESIATLHRAIDLGATLLDTAQVYGPHTNEDLVGRTIRDRRDSVVIATKFGYEIRDGQVIAPSSHPDLIRESVDGSLQRLGIDTIDLLYQHRVDPRTPIEDVAGTVGELVAAGKVRLFGLSEASPRTIRRAHAIHPVTALQSEYSLWERVVEEEILGTCQELGITFVAYCPLGRGFLTGRNKPAAEYGEDDARHFDPRMQADTYDRNLQLLEHVKRIADAKGVTPGQVALAWLLHRGDDIIPIPGTKRVKYLEENAAAAEVSLDAADMAAFDDAIPPGVTAGPRYIPKLFANIDRT
jgi:aryl-alcohol dehydrogenase-like predicted oxidoreductase